MKDLLEKLRDEGIKRGASFVEARANERAMNNIVLQDGRADKLYQRSILGTGVRVLLDGCWGFASCTGASLDEGLAALDAALAGARATRAARDEEAVVATVPAAVDERASAFETDPRSVPVARKMELLEKLDQAGFAKGQGRLVNRILSYGDSFQRETTVNSFGSAIVSEYTRTSATCTFVAQDGDVRQEAYVRKASQEGFELLERLDPSDFTEEAASRAVGLHDGDSRLPQLLHRA